MHKYLILHANMNEQYILILRKQVYFQQDNVKTNTESA